ncbi:MAG: hypothetical protein NTW32_22645 [Chloroflexi bacterium]|nr:hypothetical protein [Chloroflexota bacterium]
MTLIDARVLELSQRTTHYKERYGSLKKLETQVAQGVSADDHSLYTDLLEWRGMQDELEQVTHFPKTDEKCWRFYRTNLTNPY